MNLQAIAFEAVPPPGTVDVVAVVRHEPGGSLPNGTPNGKGGKTTYGAAWFDGFRAGEPVAMCDTQADAHQLVDLLRGPEGELWQIKDRRRRALEELEAREAEQEASAAEALAIANGGGSRAPRRSSGKRSGTTGKPSAERTPTSPPASRTTSSPRSSSSEKPPASSRGSRGPKTSHSSTAVA